MVRGSQFGALMASVALGLMLVAAPDQLQGLLRIAIGQFGFSLGICIHSCLNMMFNFVQPGFNAALLGLWGVGYAYSRGLGTISGGGLLTLLKSITGGNVIASYSGVFGLQILLFLIAALLMNRLDVHGFRNRMKVNLGAMLQMVPD